MCVKENSNDLEVNEDEVTENEIVEDRTEPQEVDEPQVQEGSQDEPNVGEQAVAMVHLDEPLENPTHDSNLDVTSEGDQRDGKDEDKYDLSHISTGEDINPCSKEATPVATSVSKTVTEMEQTPISSNPTNCDIDSTLCNSVTTNGRLVYNAVPSMNSQANDRMGHIVQGLNAMTVVEPRESLTQIQFRHPNPPHQSSLYHRNQPTQQTIGPSWYAASEKPIRNIVPAPQTPASLSSAEVNRSADVCQPHNPTSSPARKISASTPYVGSHVIASNTGPSLTVLLRRPTSERQWGFTFYGGSEYGCPPFVNKVIKNSLAFKHGMEVGDVIVSICKALTVGKTHEQLKAEMLRAGNDLDLILIRRGVDLEKISQIVPQVLQSPVRSPATSISGSSPDFTRYDDAQVRSGYSRGRSFRAVKTKCIKMLEEQLATGQTTISTQNKRYQYQGSRGVSAGAQTTSFTHAYGQNPSRGFYSPPTANRSMDVNVSSAMNRQPYCQPTAKLKHQNYYQTSYINPESGDYGQWTVTPGAQWETQSEAGCQRTPTMTHYPGESSARQIVRMTTVVPGGSPQQHVQGTAHMASSSITVPMGSYQTRQYRPY